MLASLTSVPSACALPKALQQLSDTNTLLEPCTSLLLTTLMMQVHMREKSISKPFMALKCWKLSKIMHLPRRRE